MENLLVDVFEKRRSVYALGRPAQENIKDIENLIEKLIKTAPSAFNSQSARVVVLFEKSHEAFWQIVEEKLKNVSKPEQTDSIVEKINRFKKAFGTILFFEDMNVVQKLKEDFSLYAEQFDVWSAQGNAMLEFMVWSALAAENLGASLQHYNPLVDEDVKKKWNLPQAWKLMAQMPFGRIEQMPKEKSFVPVDQRVKFFY